MCVWFAAWSYDARDRLTREVNGIGQTTDLTLDAAGNAVQELTTGSAAIPRVFSGQRLATISQSGVTRRYLDYVGRRLLASVVDD